MEEELLLLVPGSVITSATTFIAPINVDCIATHTAIITGKDDDFNDNLVSFTAVYTIKRV